MVWSKVKNIIILILAALNLCLLLLVAGQHIRSVRYEEETLRQTLEALSLNGIEAERESLPGAMEFPTLNAVRNEEEEKKMAKLLLGDAVSVTSGGGMSIYSSPNGTLSFYGGGAVIGELSFAVASVEELVDALLAGIGVEAWQVSAAEDGVTVIPVIGGAPVFNGTLALRYEGDVLVGIEGRMPGTATPERGQETPITIPTALVALLEHVTQSGTVCRAVERMTPGYYVESAGADSTRLSPCWQVQTDTVTFYVDALSGEVTREG